MAYNIESFYEGSLSPLEPTYGELFTGYRVPFSRIGAPTSIQTANQISEVSARLSEGMRVVELQPISLDVFETIPKQHWKETERLLKLTGAEATLHAPIIDPSGFTEEGWNEIARRQAEEILKMSLERAHELNPKGNVPVTFHATAGAPSTEAIKLMPNEMGDVIPAVNKDTGQLVYLRREKKYVPEEAKEILIDPEEQIREHNKRRWKNLISQIAWENSKAYEEISTSAPIVAPIYDELTKGKIKEEELLPEQRAALSAFEMGQALYEGIGSNIKAWFDEAMKVWPENVKKRKEIELMRKNLIEIEVKNLIENNPIEAARKYDETLRLFKKVISENPPEAYFSTDKFALEKSKETIANAALDAFKKFGNNAPIISIENVFPGTVFGQAEKLKELIQKAREEFVNKAKKEGISESKAKEAAQKLIGATWDVGHINLLRRYGFKEKEIVEETKKIAPFVKHVHLTDNFGFRDSHLPPGMGEVPFKEILKELEKAGFRGKEIVEAGGFVTQFKTSPTPYVLEALGSPIYGMEMQPFWNQVRGSYGLPGIYYGGYGMMLPEQHFSTYGAGFATLPMELGGSMPGKGQRFAGTPME